MKYTTSDLSRILDVSTNTIRRYEEKGYLNAVRNEGNGYRQFDHVDVEKLMYTNKYRKLGFGLEAIKDIFQGDIPHIRQCFEEKMEELDQQMAHLKALRHMLKDDVALMRHMEEYDSSILEMKCSPMHYVLYQMKGSVDIGEQQGKALHRFLSTCPEFEYIYHFAREDVEKGAFVYSEGVMANQLITQKYGIETAPPVQSYERQECLLRFVRLPLNFQDENVIGRDELWQTLFGQFLEYVAEKRLKLTGDVIGVKICLSREEGRDWQYVLIHFPVG